MSSLPLEVCKQNLDGALPRMPPRGLGMYCEATALTAEQTLLLETASYLLWPEAHIGLCSWALFCLSCQATLPSETKGLLSAWLGPGRGHPGAANLMQLFPAGFSGPGSPQQDMPPPPSQS